MNVLLVNTNRIRPPIAPIALDYLAADLTNRGHHVRLLDLCLADDPDRAAQEACAKGSPDLVAMTFRNTDDCYFASGQSFVPILKADVGRLRKACGAPIVVGGGGFSTMPERLLEHTGADYGIVGDGEGSLPRLAEARRGAIPLEKVPGLVWKTPRGWARNPPDPPDLASLDLSRRDTVDNRTYFRLGGQIGVETKRGCPGSCVYCVDPVIKGRAARTRPPEAVVAEVRRLYAQGIDHLHLCDSEFNLPPEHADAVCRRMAEAGLGSSVRWHAYAAPAPFSEDLALAMRRAGCVGVNFGADSGADTQLRRLGRAHSAEDLAATARACRRAGLVIMYDLLLGAPGETAETVAETIRLMQRIGPDRVGISLGVRVYPGTRLAQMLREEPELRRGLRGNPGSVEPAFYLAPALGEDPWGLLRGLIGRDERFFLPSGGDGQDYNYNDNTVLQEAILAGHRGAYWDILRRLREERTDATA